MSDNSSNNYSSAPLAQADLTNLLKNISKTPRVSSSTLDAPAAPDRTSTYEPPAPSVGSQGYYAPPAPDRSSTIIEPPSSNASSGSSGARRGGSGRDGPFVPDDSLAERTLFVSNMPDSVTRRDIKQIFESYGTIDSVHISRNTVTGTPFCFLAFQSPRCVDAVIDDRVNGKQFFMRDKRLSVSRRERKGPPSNKQGGGGGGRGHDSRQNSMSSSGPDYGSSSNSYSQGSWDSRPRPNQGSFGGSSAVVRIHDIPQDWHLGHLMERIQSYGHVRDSLFKWDSNGQWQGLVEFDDMNSAERLSRESLYLAQTRIKVSISDMRNIPFVGFTTGGGSYDAPPAGDFRGNKRRRDDY